MSKLSVFRELERQSRQREYAARRELSIRRIYMAHTGASERVVEPTRLQIRAMTEEELAGMDEDSTPALLDWGLSDES